MKKPENDSVEIAIRQLRAEVTALRARIVELEGSRLKAPPAYVDWPAA